MQLEPNLKAHQAMVSDKLHVHEVMTTQLLAVAPVGKVKDLVDVLQRCKHQAFPVTPDVSGAWQSGTRHILSKVYRHLTSLHFCLQGLQGLLMCCQQACSSCLASMTALRIC